MEHGIHTSLSGSGNDSKQVDTLKEQRQLVNAFNKLIRNPNSVVYTSDHSLTTGQLKKLKKSGFENDRYFLKQYLLFKGNHREIPNVLVLPTNTVAETIPIVARYTKAPFYNRCTLYSIGGPFELLHVDLADVNFTKPSASDPKYVLLAVDLFSSKIYVYPMKKINNLVKFMAKLYQDLVSDGRNENTSEPMRVQSDQEFLQNAIIKLNKEHNVVGFASKLNDGHAFAAEQKIRDLKTYINRAQRLSKFGGSRRLNGYENVKLAAKRLNSVRTTKYETIPNKVQAITAKDDNMRALYNNYRLGIVSRNNVRADKYTDKKYRRAYRKLRMLRVNDRVLVLSARLKKKDAHNTSFYKATTDRKSAFNKSYIFVVVKRIKVMDSALEPHYYYWIRPEEPVDLPKRVLRLRKERFTRAELFALHNNNV